jgi:hypothetical protein
MFPSTMARQKNQETQASSMAEQQIATQQNKRVCSAMQ